MSNRPTKAEEWRGRDGEKAVQTGQGRSVSESFIERGIVREVAKVERGSFSSLAHQCSLVESASEGCVKGKEDIKHGVGPEGQGYHGVASECRHQLNHASLDMCLLEGQIRSPTIEESGISDDPNCLGGLKEGVKGE